MPTVYDWSPLLNAINGQISNWSGRNQVGSMIDALSGTPGTAATPQTPTASRQLSLPQGGTTTIDGSVPALPATQGTPGPLSGINPAMLQMLRTAPPQVSLPLLLQLGTRQSEYDTTPRPGINPETGKLDQFVQSKDGTQRWLGIAPREKNVAVNGQMVDPYTPAGTVIPKQESPPDIVKNAMILYPNDPIKQKAYILKNSPSNLREISANASKPVNPNAPITLTHPSGNY